MQVMADGLRFQSTPSAWRETFFQPLSNVNELYFNPLPPHGGRLVKTTHFIFLHLHFNPLPPHGGRPNQPTHMTHQMPFQSTPSAWRETIRFFSDHARESFQSTPSAWRETGKAYVCTNILLFQSTPSAWRETTGDRRICTEQYRFQSTPSAWRETRYQFFPNCYFPHFNPLPPHGGRHLQF